LKPRRPDGKIEALQAADLSGGMAMATREEAEQVFREYAGPELKAGTYALIDGGGGRWLVSRRGGPLAIDSEGHVLPVGEVFSSDEYSRIAAAWAF
jgi:hypothetical protein